MVTATAKCQTTNYCNSYCYTRLLLNFRYYAIHLGGADLFRVADERSLWFNNRQVIVIFFFFFPFFCYYYKEIYDAIEANKAAAARCKEKVAQVEGANGEHGSCLEPINL